MIVPFFFLVLIGIVHRKYHARNADKRTPVLCLTTGGNFTEVLRKGSYEVGSIAELLREVANAMPGLWFWTK
jgi:hypothetical protein